MSRRIDSLEKLENCLQTDLAWRKKEMITMKLLLEKNESIESILLRSSIALLCAHFEGFIKYASNCYVKYVAAQKIESEKLKSNFIGFELRGEFKKVLNCEKNSVHQGLINELVEKYKNPFFVKDDVISTHSNPSSEELKEILLSLGIESDIFVLKSNYIDGHLLSNRHKVVHGDRFSIDKKEFYNTFNEIMELIDKYEELIVESAEKRKYMKESA